jgi:uncharacterized protein YndB with AHSA1/START domain
MGIRKAKIAAVVLPLLLFNGFAQAEVKSSAPGGFEVTETVDIKAPARRVYTALGKIGRWWSSKHTVTGNAANLFLDLGIKGCFCEKGIDGVQRRHMDVVDIAPDQQVRLRGALGPLQGAGVDGALTWTIKPAEGGVTFTQTYNVGGYFPGGLDMIAPHVEQVLHEQLMRFKSFVETGSPENQSK